MKRIICLCLTVIMLLSLSSCALDHELNSLKSQSKPSASDKEDTDIECVITESNGIEYYFFVSDNSCVLRAINVTDAFENNNVWLPTTAPNGAPVTGYHINSFYNVLPTVMSVGDFEQLISNTELTAFEKNQLISFYSLRDLDQHLQKFSGEQKRQEELKKFVEKYPLTVNMPIYVFNGITPKEHQTVEDIFERLGYTYEHHLAIVNRLLKAAKGNQKALESVNIPSNLSILEKAEQLVIPDSATELTLRIANASNLKKIVMPEVIEKSGGLVFYGCSSLKSFDFPKGVEVIENDAFYGCVKLQSVTLPDGLLKIEDRAFAGCAWLSGITIPAGVTSIGSSVFADCTSLTEVTVPDGVKSVETGTFLNCSSLTTVNLPASIGYIGESAFQHCSKLERINYNNTYDGWRFMTRGLYWYENTGDFIVSCTNKDVPKEEANWPINENN